MPDENPAHPPTEILRHAAALMRERAEAATPGPWEPGEHCIWNSILQPDGTHIGQVIVSDGQAGDGGIAAEEDAEHIASWHPAVALAVADWLDREDDEWERHYDEWWSMHLRAWDRANNGAMPDKTREHFERTAAEYADGQHRPALTVARAYLGEVS